jgi:hypothetical protein
MYFNFQIVGTLSIVIADDIGQFIRFIFFLYFFVRRVNTIREYPVLQYAIIKFVVLYRIFKTGPNIYGS